MSHEAGARNLKPRPGQDHCVQVILCSCKRMSQTDPGYKPSSSLKLSDQPQFWATLVLVMFGPSKHHKNPIIRGTVEDKHQLSLDMQLEIQSWRIPGFVNPGSGAMLHCTQQLDIKTKQTSTHSGCLPANICPNMTHLLLTSRTNTPNLSCLS